MQGAGSRESNRKATSTANVKKGRCLRLGSQQWKCPTAAGSGRGGRRPGTTWKGTAAEAGNGGVACTPGRGVPLTGAGHTAGRSSLTAKLWSWTCCALGHSSVTDCLSSERIFFDKESSRSKKWPKYRDFLNQIPKVKPKNHHTCSHPRPFRSRTAGPFINLVSTKSPHQTPLVTTHQQDSTCFVSWAVLKSRTM